MAKNKSIATLGLIQSYGRSQSYTVTWARSDASPLIHALNERAVKARQQLDRKRKGIASARRQAKTVVGQTFGLVRLYGMRPRKILAKLLPRGYTPPLTPPRQWKAL